MDQILQLQSAGAAGDDFGRDCSGSSCTYTVLETGAYGAAGYIAVPAGTGSGELHDDMHSRIVWNYIQNPVVNLGETPDMYFQMAHAAYGSCSGSGASDDIGWAVGAYDTGADEWGWTPQLDGSGCYQEVVTDGHDNSTVPLPWGEYEMYYKDYDVPSYFHVVYWDGSTWGDERDINFYWDGSSTTGPDHECIDNVSAVVWIDPADPGNPHEGMFFKIVDSDECSPYIGLDDEAGVDGADSAIVFARRRN